ncbi:hypothetical protein BGZ80_010929 [Entomortierella chlamydospora]|uniref:Uncharacterized protein n=1 Tax=Entomortierella chlamydospora TaxID=101097 RepID=A0A9P6SZD6_9FUNG|nr:hypothetical protein BGZ80_010929 [Entomortierella chlamydospora]
MSVSVDYNLGLMMNDLNILPLLTIPCRTTKETMSKFAPTHYRYKKRKTEDPLTVGLPDAETRKNIFRQVEHEDDYRWGKRARLGEQLSAMAHDKMH